jgi:hypothetical protein
MKKLGIRRLDATSSHLVKMHDLQKINQSVGGTDFWGFILDKH